MVACVVNHLLLCKYKKIWMNEKQVIHTIQT
jgi:hypothetical protein